jgi:anti-sigma factor RsiW
MKRCPSEGELRACLDGELPAGRIDAIAAHKAGCPRCAALAGQLAQRSARVSALLSALPATEPVASLPLLPHTGRRRWVAAGALAACAILGVIVGWVVRGDSQPSPGNRAAVARPAAQVPATDPAPLPAAAPAPQVAERAPAVQPLRREPARPAPRHVVASNRPQAAPASLPRASEVRYFIPLDNEPVDAGTVVRVVLGPYEVPADVLFGPDGRARAIRLVGDRY